MAAEWDSGAASGVLSALTVSFRTDSTASLVTCPPGVHFRNSICTVHCGRSPRGASPVPRPHRPVPPTSSEPRPPPGSASRPRLLPVLDPISGCHGLCWSVFLLVTRRDGHRRHRTHTGGNSVRVSVFASREPSHGSRRPRPHRSLPLPTAPGEGGAGLSRSSAAHRKGASRSGRRGAAPFLTLSGCIFIKMN